MRNYAEVFLFLTALIPARAQVISAVAGTGVQSYKGDGGAALSAWISMPTGIALDSAGNLYFSDNANRVVRQVNSSGIINAYAGNEMVFLPGGDGGPATNAGLGWGGGSFFGLAIDKAGNLYISDAAFGVAKVRKVDASGVITTFAGAQAIPGGDGGPATSAGLGTAAGLAVDSQGNLYIADTVGERIRKVDTTGIITTVAGTGVANYSGDGGPAINATLSVPVGVAVDGQGNIYITEAGNAQNGPRIRKVDSSGKITTVAGNGKYGFGGDGGSALNAEFGNNLQGIAVDNAGNLYIADYGNYRIRRVDTSGNISTIAGNGQSGGSANNGNGGLASQSLVQPSGLALDAAGNLYISDFSGAEIRKITFGATPPGLSASVASLYFASLAGHNATPQPQSVVVSTTGPSISFTVSATTASGGAWLSTSAASGATPKTIGISINTSPAGAALAQGTYNGTLTFTPTTPGYTTTVTIPVTLVLSATVPSSAPVISAVVNGASFSANQSIAPNTYITIQGTNLSTATSTWNDSIIGGQLPTSLNGVTVTFSSLPGYISYVSPTQINVLAPPMAAGTAPVQVNNNGAISAALTVGVAGKSPAFFELSGNQVIATRTDYTYAAKNGSIPGLSTTPAKPGDVLILWGTGFGASNPAVPSGVLTPGDQIYSASDSVTVTINGVPVTVYGVGLTPGLAGVYQVAIQVPQSLANGDWPLIATTQDGFSSSGSVILTVHN